METMKPRVPIAMVIVLFLRHDQHKSANQLSEKISADIQAICVVNPRRLTRMNACAKANGPMLAGKQMYEAIIAAMFDPTTASR